MPLKDGTGPLGQGPKTGRGLGNCSGSGVQNTNVGAGQGMGRGMGQAANLPSQDQK